MARKISQREARRLKKRVQELERERESLFSRFRNDWAGVDLAASMQASVEVWHILNTAYRLGYAVAVSVGDNWKLSFRAHKS